MKMDNTNIIPSAASIHLDYQNFTSLQKRAADAIVDAAKQGRNNTSLKLTTAQGNYLVPILRKLGYSALCFPSKDDTNNLYVFLDIEW